MATPALRRIKKELSDIDKGSNDNFELGAVDEDNPFVWQAKLKGPVDSPYEGGIFTLSITLGEKYPFQPPRVVAITPVYHPNFSLGNICLDILNHQWSPILTISKVMFSIISLLCDPNPDDPLDHKIAKVYMNDRPAYQKEAREWTRKFAMTHEKKDGEAKDSAESAPV